MSTTSAVASPNVGSAVTGMQDKLIAVIGNGDLVAVTILSTVGLLMTIFLAVYLGPLDDPTVLPLQISEASQIKIVQSIASSDEGNADRMDVGSIKTSLRPVPDADGAERADDQPLMATGLDLKGPPKRFSAKEALENIEVQGF
jgi:hypothetical protein